MCVQVCMYVNDLFAPLLPIARGVVSQHVFALSREFVDIAFNFPTYSHVIFKLYWVYLKLKICSFFFITNYSMLYTYTYVYI